MEPLPWCVASMVTSNDNDTAIMLFVLDKLLSNASILDIRESDGMDVAVGEVAVVVVSSFFMFATRIACRCTSARYKGAIRGEGGEQRPGIPP